MATYKTADFESALKEKGFKENRRTRHKKYRFYYKGKKTSVITYTSHGEKEFGESILRQRREQMKLRKKQEVIDFIKCPLDKNDYTKILIDAEVVKLREKKESHE